MSKNKLYTFDGVSEFYRKWEEDPESVNVNSFNAEKAFKTIANSKDDIHSKIEQGGRVLSLLSKIKNKDDIDFDKIAKILEPVKKEFEDNFERVYYDITCPFMPYSISFVALMKFDESKYYELYPDEYFSIYVNSFESMAGDFDDTINMMQFIGFDFSPYPEIIKIANERLENEDLVDFRKYIKQVYTFDEIEKYCDEGLGFPLKRFDQDVFDYKLAFESIVNNYEKKLEKKLELSNTLLEYVFCTHCDKEISVDFDEGIPVDFDEIKKILKPLKKQCEDNYDDTSSIFTKISCNPSIELLALTGFKDDRKDIFNIFTKAFKNIRDYGDMECITKGMMYIGFDFFPYPEVIEIIQDKLYEDGSIETLEIYNKYLEKDRKGYRNPNQMFLAFTRGEGIKAPSPQ